MGEGVIKEGGYFSRHVRRFYVSRTSGPRVEDALPYWARVVFYDDVDGAVLLPVGIYTPDEDIVMWALLNQGEGVVVEDDHTYVRSELLAVMFPSMARDTRKIADRLREKVTRENNFKGEDQ